MHMHTALAAFLLCFMGAQLATAMPKGEFTQISVADLTDDRYVGRDVMLSGIVDDAIRDEIDKKIALLAVNDNGNVALVPIRAAKLSDREISSYIGACVRIKCRCFFAPSLNRHVFGYLLTPYDVQILTPSSTDYSALPSVSELKNLLPSKISSMGRHRAIGRVRAVWGGNRILLTTDFGTQCLVQLRELPPPKYGDTVEVVGIPETDLYRINMNRASWRHVEAPNIPINEPVSIPTNGIVSHHDGHVYYEAQYYGRPVRLRGKVLNSPTSSNDNIIYLECEGASAAVDFSSLTNATTRLSVGAIADVTGVCIFDIENWQPGAILPHINGYRIVPRKLDDIVIVSPPPWWTAGKFLVVVSILSVGLCFTVYRITVQRHFSRLRLFDRTRLSIDLHDSVSQNLTSVSLQINAAMNLVKVNPDKATHRLEVAARTIDSCHDELRACIADLRENALGCSTMAEAINLVLAPYFTHADISVRFHVQRHLLDDNLTHAVLRIVRELVVNAIRHGHAKNIRVAGSTENSHLLFSVTDNGDGFNTETIPGITEGHFGLAGIKERVKMIGGSVDIKSSPGHGTRIAITLTGTQS